MGFMIKYFESEGMRRGLKVNEEKNIGMLFDNDKTVRVCVCVGGKGTQKDLGLGCAILTLIYSSKTLMWKEKNLRTKDNGQ